MKKTIIAAVFMALAIFAGCAPSHRVLDGKNMSAVFFDVGQGDSALLVTADNKKILIDCGEFNDTAFYLQQINITMIDVLVETHPDKDHVGGCDEVKKVADVGMILTNNNVREDFALELTETAFIDIIVAYDSNGRFKEDNDNSIVLKAVYGDVEFLFTGDCSWKCENELAKTDGRKLRADILKAGHHGSKYSSTSSFLEKVKPSAAVISCGKDNKYGHPADEALERLENAGAKVYRTDINGSVIVTTDGKRYSIA